jgi:hypothetical protein
MTFVTKINPVNFFPFSIKVMKRFLLIVIAKGTGEAIGPP